jgi:hypothetical protein
MEDYVWILILGAFWLFEITNRARKKKGQTEDGEPGASRPDPRSARQELARDVDRAARRAEDTLKRREQQQQQAPVPMSVPAARRRPVGEPRRRDAFEAIAAMLAAPPEKTARAPVARRQEAAAPGRPPAARPRPAASRRPDVEMPPPPAVGRRRGRDGMRHLARLPEIQRAIVLSEILGLPVSLAPRRAFQLDSDQGMQDRQGRVAK